MNEPITLIARVGNREARITLPNPTVEIFERHEIKKPDGLDAAFTEERIAVKVVDLDTLNLVNPESFAAYRSALGWFVHRTLPAFAKED